MFGRISEKLDVIIWLLNDLRKKETYMIEELNDLEAAVTENTNLDMSIIDLVNGLAAQIEMNSDFPIKMRALAASLREKSIAISAAIQANTAPVPIPEPPPVEEPVV
jgi:hypothetical protein